jgi:YidC/Oxa1 family membrane protein insertase
MAIRNHYKGRNDQATQMKVNEEIQALYERENFNPMSGCLPMLIQLPIIMLLYNIVIDPVQYVLGSTASFGAALKAFFTASTAAGGLGQTLNSANGTIEILSLIKNHDFSGLADFAMITDGAKVLDTLNGFGTLPTFSIGPVNFGYTPSFDRNQWLLIVPALTFVIYFFTMKISKKFTYQATTNEQAPGAGCSTKVMEFYMPVVSTMFSFAVPGAVGIYWVFRSILSTIKQFIMSKVMPLPRFTDEDYKQAEKEMYAKVPQRKRKNTQENLDPNREKPRSLHHIDDDEEEYITFIK